MQTLIKPLFENVNIAFVNNSLAEKMLKHYSSTTETPLNSSYSLLSILVPLLIGSNGETFMELCTLLQISPNVTEKIYSNFKEIHDILENHNKVVQVNNLLLSKSSINLKSDYLQKISQFCSHKSFEQSEIPELSNKINLEVATKTHGLVENILNSSDINDDTIFVFLNTIYFKCEWLTHFLPDNTLLKPFFGLEQRNVQMMHHYFGSFRYTETSTSQILYLPYKSKEFGFCVVLPKDRNYKSPILNNNMLINALKNTKIETVNVALPKFTQEIKLDLIPFFKSMNVKTMFTDLEILQMTDNTELKYISMIKQKVKVIVSEQGTETSSATISMYMKELYRVPNSKPVVDFVADHPFTYYIMYENMILFSGTYA